MESMRDLGYSLETALADILDNSIAADASCVDILFETGGEPPIVGILDDGCGMSRKELLEAMRPGSHHPLEERSISDLGRFGLGLKTASFSQCQCLTVVSRKDGEINAARWDLDLVACRNEWLLQIPDPDEVERIPWFQMLHPSGTLVVWERMDRLADRTSGSDLKDHLYERLRSSEQHLSLVFHRYLQGERPFRKLTLRINGSVVASFDPFNSRHPATQMLPLDILPVDGHQVEVQPFILPHHRKAGSKIYEQYAGEGGYLRNQGFYVYRHGRLIIHGTWFRLVKKSELIKLARVRVDMPTGLDHLWKIDVRKASVQPPYVVRERLGRIIDRITHASNRVYTSRGARVQETGIISLWLRRVDKGEVFYEINREHPLLFHFIDNLSPNRREHFETVLQAMERCFPVDSFYADTAAHPESMKPGGIPDETMRLMVEVILDTFMDRGSNADEIVRTIETTEPYRSNQGAVMAVLKDRGIVADVD